MQLQNKVLLLHHQNVIELWCNGNTTDSGPVILGSNPGSSTPKTAPNSGAVFCWKGSQPLRVPGRFFVWRRGGEEKKEGRPPGFSTAPLRAPQPHLQKSSPRRIPERFFIGKVHGRFGFRNIPHTRKGPPVPHGSTRRSHSAPRTIIPHNNPEQYPPRKKRPRPKAGAAFRIPGSRSPGPGGAIFRAPCARSAPGFRACGRGNARRAPWDAPCRPFRGYSPGTTWPPPR